MSKAKQSSADKLNFMVVGSRGYGEIFGELALLSNKPRAARVVCLSDCYFATLDRRSFEIIQKAQEKLLYQKVDQIGKVAQFSSLSRHTLMKYQNYFEEKTHVRGSIL